MNGFPDLKSPNFNPKHDFLSKIEAEIISFLLKKAAIFIFVIFVEAEIISFYQRRQPFAFSAFYIHPLTFEGGSPSKFDR